MTPSEIVAVANDPAATTEQIERAAEALIRLPWEGTDGADSALRRVRNHGRARLEAALMRREAKLKERGRNVSENGG